MRWEEDPCPMFRWPRPQDEWVPRAPPELVDGWSFIAIVGCSKEEGATERSS